MNKYKKDKDINIERENIKVNVEKLPMFGPRSKTPPTCTLTADRLTPICSVPDFIPFHLMTSVL